jgi:hypothetical protein
VDRELPKCQSLPNKYSKPRRHVARGGTNVGIEMYAKNRDEKLMQTSISPFETGSATLSRRARKVFWRQVTISSPSETLKETRRLEVSTFYSMIPVT